MPGPGGAGAGIVNNQRSPGAADKPLQRRSMNDDDDHVLTRDVLLDGTLDRIAALAMPDLRLMTEVERQQSLRDTLAVRPPGPVWLFAYGSLIWNPTVRFAERRVARIHGWHRAFCLSTRMGRGSNENPGLVLGLDRGGACTGAAFRLEEDALDEELPLIWRREMLAGSYVPRWAALRGRDGAIFGHGICFTINRDAEQYAGKLDRAEVVRRLATARGDLGSAADYLFRTRDGLRLLGIRDPGVERLADAVAGATA